MADVKGDCSGPFVGPVRTQRTRPRSGPRTPATVDSRTAFRSSHVAGHPRVSAYPWGARTISQLRGRFLLSNGVGLNPTQNPRWGLIFHCRIRRFVAALTQGPGRGGSSQFPHPIEEGKTEAEENLCGRCHRPTRGRHPGRGAGQNLEGEGADTVLRAERGLEPRTMMRVDAQAAAVITLSRSGARRAPGPVMFSTIPDVGPLPTVPPTLPEIRRTRKSPKLVSYSKRGPPLVSLICVQKAFLEAVEAGTVKRSAEGRRCVLLHELPNRRAQNDVLFEPRAWWAHSARC